MPAVDPVAFNASTRVSWSQITNKPDWTENITGGGYNPLVIDLMNGRVTNSGPVREFDSPSVQDATVITKSYVDRKTESIDDAVTWDEVTNKPQWTRDRFTITPNDNLLLRGNLDMDRSVIINVSDPFNPLDAANRNYVDTELGERDDKITELTNKINTDIGNSAGAVLREAKAYTDTVLENAQEPDWSDVQNKPEFLTKNVFEYATAGDRNQVNVFTDLDMSNMQIKDLGDPSLPTDAANKRFVESKVAGMATTSVVDEKIATALSDADNPEWVDVQNKPEWTDLIESRRTQLNGSDTTVLNFKVNVDLNNSVIANVSAPIAAKDAANKEWVERVIGTSIGDISVDVPIADHLTLDNNTAPTEIVTALPLNMNNKRMRGVVEPITNDHPANKKYVDDKTWDYATKITNKPTIPTKTSEITNDSNFITTTASQTAIDTKFSEVVDDSPTRKGRIRITNRTVNPYKESTIGFSDTGATCVPVRADNWDIMSYNSFVPSTNQAWSLGTHGLRWNYIHSAITDSAEFARLQGQDMKVSVQTYGTNGSYVPFTSWKFQPNSANDKVLDLVVVPTPVAGSTVTPLLKASNMEANQLTLSGSTPTTSELSKASNVDFVMKYLASVNAAERFLQSHTTFQVNQTYVSDTQMRIRVRVRTDDALNGTQPMAHIFVRLIKFKVVVSELGSASELSEIYNSGSSEIPMVIVSGTNNMFTYDGTITTTTPAFNRSNIQITYSPVLYINVKDAGDPHVFTNRQTYMTAPLGRALEVACPPVRVSPPSLSS